MSGFARSETGRRTAVRRGNPSQTVQRGQWDCPRDLPISRPLSTRQDEPRQRLRMFVPFPSAVDTPSRNIMLIPRRLARTKTPVPYLPVVVKVFKSKKMVGLLLLQVIPIYFSSLPMRFGSLWNRATVALRMAPPPDCF